MASCPYFDVFATTIMDWDLPMSLYRDIAERTVRMAKKYGKESERWIQGYFEGPTDYAQIDQLVDLYAQLGVDRISCWTYRGGYGTNLASKEPLELWDHIGETYKRVLTKE